VQALIVLPMVVAEGGFFYLPTGAQIFMESATLWKVDATEAALRAERGLDRFP
jgi:hypothetical protein